MAYRPIPDQCLQLLEQVEAFSSTVYRDEAGYPTIGYGHRLLPSESNLKVITQAEGLALLREDLGLAATTVTNATQALDLNDNQYSALVCFTFNAGVSAFANSTLLKLLKAGNLTAAAAQFVRWDKVRDPQTGQMVESEGLLNRRRAEMALFQKAI